MTTASTPSAPQGIPTIGETFTAEELRAEMHKAFQRGLEEGRAQGIAGCPAWCEDHWGDTHRSITNYVDTGEVAVGVHAAQVGESPIFIIDGRPYSQKAAGDFAELIQYVCKSVGAA